MAKTRAGKKVAYLLQDSRSLVVTQKGNRHQGPQAGPNLCEHYTRIGGKSQAFST